MFGINSIQHVNNYFIKHTTNFLPGGNFKNFANGLKREYSILDHFFNCGTYPVPIKLNFNNERSLSRFLIPEFEQVDKYDGEILVNFVRSFV